ncbi:hypothetical protein J25TS5_35900 [Paenibacillus faecis]|nr:hypothetical protein J25TS5_35900 [Paenibacillus faecis]
MARETVVTPTPHIFAISIIVIEAISDLPLLRNFYILIENIAIKNLEDKDGSSRI